MKALRIGFVALFLAALGCGGLQAAPSPAPLAPQFPGPHAVVALFLEAVDRGELQVFEQTLDRTMIVPRRVEYVYDLDTYRPAVKVYADLRRPVAIPGVSDCEVRAVLVTLDAGGAIVDVEVHVWQEPKPHSGARPAVRRASGGALACR